MRILAAAVLCAVAGAALGQQQQQQEDPCTKKSKVVGDVTYCDRYWECVVGVPQQYDCPNGLVFVGRNRGIAEGCDYPWRGAYCLDEKLANPPIATEHCDWLYGIFGHETSCTRYWTCWNGTATEQFCIGGLLYNEETHACDWPQNVAGCQKHPLCKDDPNANVPLGKSCERYWACQGGYPRLQRCPATLVFDKQSRRCVSPPTIDCDIPSTTPSPQDSERPDFRQTIAARPPPRRRPTTNIQQLEPLAEDKPFVAPERNFQSGGDRNFQSGGDRNFQSGGDRNFQPGGDRNFQSVADPRPSVARPIPVRGPPPPPIQGGNFRPAPIAGAIPLNLK